MGTEESPVDGSVAVSLDRQPIELTVTCHTAPRTTTIPTQFGGRFRQLDELGLTGIDQHLAIVARPALASDQHDGVFLAGPLVELSHDGEAADLHCTPRCRAMRHEPIHDQG